MTFPLEYHKDVRYFVQRPLSATVAAFAIFLFLATSSQAQLNSSSHGVSAAPPTAMTVAPPTGAVHAPTAGFTHTPTASTNWSTTHASNFPHPSGGSHNGTHHSHHTANGTAYYPYIYAVPIPYALDMSDTDNSSDEEDNDANYQGGPTVFDRRGAGEQSYIPPDYSGPAHQVAADNADPEPEPPQPPTTLIFKDGHQLEVSNYAIVSQTLYDLTPGHSRKVALADLDLPATEKQNDDHGVIFQLPPGSQAN